MANVRYTVPVVLKEKVDDIHNFKSLPDPTGIYPYRLNINDVLGEEYNRVGLEDNICFHMVGDTGSVRHSAFQSLIAQAMQSSVSLLSSSASKPEFLYHLGDIVYNYGEAKEYPLQFLNAYENYDAPIFAIPGNHDGDINPQSETPYQSLEAFTDVFCDSHRRLIGFGKGSKRLSMNQPNVYWTLETPLVRFVGLYANVTKHGTITTEQEQWFIEELRYAKEFCRHQALIICIHHAPYSIDVNHGSSIPVVDFLERSFEASGVRPDAVFSGHVHNYQRFSKHYDQDVIVPYFVAGAGGYADLHRGALLDDISVEALDSCKVTLESFCDDCFGFLNVRVSKMDTGLRIMVEYHVLPVDAVEHGHHQTQVFDHFEWDIERAMSVL